MLSLFITHLQGYKRQAVRSPVFITLEVICELILPLIMAEIVDVAIPAGDTAYIFRLGAVMLALSLLSMAFGVLSAKYATFASQGFGANLRQCLFDKVQEFSFADIDRFSSASLITRIDVYKRQGVLLPVRGKVPLRVEDAADIAVTEGQPAVLRGRGQLGQDGGAQLQHLAALQPPPDGKQLGQLLRPARGAQQLQRRPLVRSKGQ